MPVKPGDAVNEFYDKKFEKARTIAIYMAESKIWKKMLENCCDYTGVMKQEKCQLLLDIVAERQKYYNSNFNPECRPRSSPGLPEEYEFKGYPDIWNKH
jgi:hypothetical protein